MLVRQADGRSRTPRTRLFSGCRYPDAGGFGQEPTSGRNLRNDACRISLAARTAAGGSPFGGRFLECLWGDGGENSMIRFVENNWASKDYTHLSFRGGKEIASALLKAILLEKEFYDEADKVAH